jgi:putative SOS response-associated peptidase YedK
MCGRFTLTADLPTLQACFPGVAFPSAYAPRYNIAPGQPILMIEAKQPLAATFALWGFVPAWAKAAPQRHPTGPYINARTETAARKAAFRGAWRNRRCLIPADGFYEWQQEGRARLPWYFCLQERRPFAFAGLWEEWQGSEGEVLRTCLILTVAANERFRPIHERMPLILFPEEYEEWLSPCPSESPERWLRPFPAERMCGYRVSPRVNRSDVEGKALIEPLQETQGGLFTSLA